jgi:L-ascorbate metabolism protein UlaG (beta-lactamase superfamily)
LIVTHIGGPTALIEVDGWRLLTDPTFDPAGGHYAFGWGTSSDKLTGPAVSVADVSPIDVVLLTHDHHGDNLDVAGRAMLPTVTTVLTTVSGARRLSVGGPVDLRGLAAGATTRLEADGKPTIEVTATPARHGPPLTGPLVGDVIGFALRRPAQEETLLWITGDTVLHRRLRVAAAAMKVTAVLVHVGGVRFPITGPLRYTMTARRATELCELVRPRVAVPVHYEGWAHFKDGRAAVEQALSAAPAEVRNRVRWLPLGSPVEL